MTTDIREGDVFHFRWRADKRPQFADHCFEGVLVVCPSTSGYILVDTFWGIGDTQGRTWTLEEAEKRGELIFYVNLTDIEPIKDYEQGYYDDGDLFVISRQHACVKSCVYHYKRKGAERSQAKMLSVLDGSIQKEEQNITSAVSRIQRLAATRQQVQDGNLAVYL